MSIAEVHVLAASAGNEFMLDIAAAVVQGMREVGVTTELKLDAVPATARPGLLQVVIAPHEYGPLYLDAALAGPGQREALAATYALNVEQPGGPWFERGWAYAQHCRGAFDISPEGAAEFRRRGLGATYTPLGTATSPAAPPAQECRPIDIVFLGHASPRREQFFADHAAAFAARTCRLHFVDLAHPRRANTPGYVTGNARAQLLGQSKILLNLHAAERPYFERHRALLAFVHGCALVTETSTGTAPLVDGTHFVMAPLHELAEASLRLLDDPDRRVAIAAAGHSVASQLSMADSCRSMLEYAAVAEAPDASGAGEVQERRAVRQRLAESRSIRDRGGCDWDHHDNAACRSGRAARISVIVTVYNYACYLDECVQSVLASQPVPGGFELVIVDDASHDGSAERARALADAAAVPVTVVAKHSNTGLGDARNLGVQLARGSLVLTLDADNWIFPACLRLLAEALADETVAAAYPLLRRFHDGTGASAGLLSLLPWSPRELVRGPYIDALAMFRRDVLVAVGGYATDLVDYGWFGWEDYDLWLTLARTGHLCRHVPAVLASYRVHERSMIGRTNRSTEAIARHLAEKHASLIGEHPGLDRYLGFPATDADGAAPPASLDSMALAHRCRDLGAEVQGLRASWSWRVTAPLRFVYRQLGLERR